MQQSMLTTDDNPYDPFTQWNEWFTFDTSHGYNSAGLVARITISSPELSQADQELAIDQAIDEIVELNISGKHKKVTREVPSETEGVPVLEVVKP